MSCIGYGERCKGCKENMSEAKYDERCEGCKGKRFYPSCKKYCILDFPKEEEE